MKGMKKCRIVNLLILICLSFLFLNFPTTKATDTKPTIWIKIHRIEGIDDIEGWLEGGPDWYYVINVFDGAVFQTFTISTLMGDGLVDNTHSFTLSNYPSDDIIALPVGFNGGPSSTSTVFYITLLESDWGTDEVADISSNSLVVESDQRIPAPVGAVYWGCYNFETNSLSGDSTYFEEGYYKTSGDYDGSTSTDENDADLWFNIWDNYNVPKAVAGVDLFCYVGEKVNFDGSGSSASIGSSISKYEWDFESDGGIDAEGARTSFTFPKKEIYTVTLMVTDSIGNTDSETLTVTVGNKPPIPSFTFSPNEPTIRDKIHFYDTSEDPDGTLASWYWNFGDGHTSTIKDPTHDYLDKGSYTVTLRVTDDDGNSDSITKILSFINLAPVSDFTYSPTKPIVGKDIQFSDKSSDPEGKTLEYLWDFGDGFTSTQRNPKHKFTSEGRKNVRLTVTDDEGSEESIQKSIQIITNRIPNAEFSYSPENPKMNHGVQFTDESTDSDGFIVGWFWSFGDGSTSTIENPVHGYEEGGEYSVKLTVTDDADDNEDKIKIVKILQTHDLTVEVKDILGVNIANAEIELYADGESCASGKTDTNGKLTFTEIAEGQYDIKVKVMGQTVTTTRSLSQPATAQVQVTLSTNTLGITGGIVVIAVLAGFYLIRRKKTALPPEETNQEVESVSVVEDDSLKEKKKELERERIAEILQTFKDSFEKGEMDEETYLRLKTKYEKELEGLG